MSKCPALVAQESVFAPICARQPRYRSAAALFVLAGPRLGNLHIRPARPHGTAKKTAPQEGQAAATLIGKITSGAHSWAAKSVPLSPGGL